MTAILALNLGDRVVMMSDTACLEPDDSHRVQRFERKMIALPNAGAVIAITGLGFLELFLDELAAAGRSYTSDVDLYDRMPTDLRQFFEARRHKLPGDNVGSFHVLCASFGTIGPRVAEMDGPFAPEQAHLVKPWEWQTEDGHQTGRAERWLRFTGFGGTVFPEAFAAAARECCSPAYEAPYARRPFDLVEHGIPYFEAVRRTRFQPGDFHAVGGELEAAVIASDGAARFHTLKQWSDDRAGVPLNPGETA